MPKPDPYATSVAVACEGPLGGETRSSPAGMRRSREGAQLHQVEADAIYWHQTYRQHSLTPHHTLLVNPTQADVLDAVTEAVAELTPYACRSEWIGGQFDFAFAGHGSRSGGLVLIDGELNGMQLLDAIFAGRPDAPGKLRVSLVLDSCHSALTLGQVLTDSRHPRDFLLVDAFAACLHDENAWELDMLGHGALTFSMRQPGNAHVDPIRLARAVRDRDQDYLLLALHAFTPNPVTYLTQGDQTSIDVINGHAVTVKGGGNLEMREGLGLSDLLVGLEFARDADLGAQVIL